VNWFKFNEGSGTNAINTQNPGAGDGFKSGFATYDTNVPNYSSPNSHSVNFNGASAFMRAPNTGNMPTGDFSYSSWINPQSSVTGNRGNIVNIGEPGSSFNPNREFNYRLNPAGKIEVYTDQILRITSNTTVPTSGTTWTHVAVTRSGSDIKLYINGVEDTNTGTDSTTLNFGPGGTGCEFIVGATYDGGCFTTSETFPGYIDDVRQYNTALSAADIKTLAGLYTISIANTTNAAEPSTNGLFTISLDRVNTTGGAIDMTIIFSGTAIGGTDYTGGFISGADYYASVSIPNGSSGTTLSINTTDDALNEGTETVIATFNGGTNIGGFSTYSGASATINLTDDDVPVDATRPTVTINQSS
jgi:hypothetical protein